ncbi:MAG: PfkB family carbohydrate kinase [Candidatus Roizmanbacteria bacterium]
MKIACVGDVALDDYVDEGIKKPGGICLNFAVHASLTGSSCSILSSVGTDEVGNKVKQLLKKLQFDISHLSQLDGATAKQKIRLTRGERKFVGYDAGTLLKWKLGDEDLRFILQHDAVFAPLSDGLEDIFETICHLKGSIIKIADFSKDYKPVNLDVGDTPFGRYFKYFDMIFIGGDEDMIPLIKKMSLAHPQKLFVLTLGDKGSRAYRQDKQYVQMIVKAREVIDTTGCGDAFQGAFSASYLRDHNIKKALHKGAKEAATVVAYIGSTEYSL